MDHSLLAAFLICTTTAIVMATFLINQDVPIYHPSSIYCIYFMVGFCLRPLAIFLSGKSQIWGYIGYIPDSKIILLTAVYSSLGFIAFLITPFLINENLYARFRYEQPHFQISREIGFYAAVLFLLLAGLYGVWSGYGVADSSEVLGYSVDVDAKGGQRLVDVSGYQTALAEFLPSLLLTLFFLFGASRPIAVLILAFVVLRIWIGAGRNAFVLLAFGMAMIAVMRAKLRFIPAKYIAGALIIGYIFDVVGSDRLAFRKLLDGEVNIKQILDQHQSSRGNEGLLSDVQEFDVTATLISVIPDVTGFNWGSQYLRLLIWPIPRQIWENKPVYTSLIDLSTLGNFFGLTWTLNADLYSNFGLLSLLIGMTIIGYTLAYGARLLSQANTFSGRMSYWIFLIYLPILYRDGPVTYVYFTIFALLPPLILERIGGIQLVRRG